jgi:hypothetical protein
MPCAGLDIGRGTGANIVDGVERLCGITWIIDVHCSWTKSASRVIGSCILGE